MSERTWDEMTQQAQLQRKARSEAHDAARRELADPLLDIGTSGPMYFPLTRATVRAYQSCPDFCDQEATVEAYRDDGTVDRAAPLAVPHLSVQCLDVDGLTFVHAGYRTGAAGRDLVSLHLEPDGSLIVHVCTDPITGRFARLRWEELRDRVADLGGIRDLPSPTPESLLSPALSSKVGG